MTPDGYVEQCNSGAVCIFGTNQTAFEERLGTLRERKAYVIEGGRQPHIERHRKRGKLLVRDRIDMLLDAETAFLEIAPLLPGASMATRFRQPAS